MKWRNLYIRLITSYTKNTLGFKNKLTKKEPREIRGSFKILNKKIKKIKPKTRVELGF